MFLKDLYLGRVSESVRFADLFLAENALDEAKAPPPPVGSFTLYAHTPGVLAVYERVPTTVSKIGWKYYAMPDTPKGRGALAKQVAVDPAFFDKLKDKHKTTIQAQLPNFAEWSAGIKAAGAELQAKGYSVADLEKDSPFMAAQAAAAGAPTLVSQPAAVPAPAPEPAVVMQPVAAVVPPVSSPVPQSEPDKAVVAAVPAPVVPAVTQAPAASPPATMQSPVVVLAQAEKDAAAKTNAMVAWFNDQLGTGLMPASIANKNDTKWALKAISIYYPDKAAAAAAEFGADWEQTLLAGISDPAPETVASSEPAPPIVVPPTPTPMPVAAPEPEPEPVPVVSKKWTQAEREEAAQNYLATPGPGEAFVFHALRHETNPAYLTPEMALDWLPSGVRSDLEKLRKEDPELYAEVVSQAVLALKENSAGGATPLSLLLSAIEGGADIVAKATEERWSRTYSATVLAGAASASPLMSNYFLSDGDREHYFNSAKLRNQLKQEGVHGYKLSDFEKFPPEHPLSQFVAAAHEASGGDANLVYEWVSGGAAMPAGLASPEFKQFVLKHVESDKFLTLAADMSDLVQAYGEKKKKALPSEISAPAAQEAMLKTLALMAAQAKNAVAVGIKAGTLEDFDKVWSLSTLNDVQQASLLNALAAAGVTDDHAEAVVTALKLKAMELAKTEPWVAPEQLVSHPDVETLLAGVDASLSPQIYAADAFFQGKESKADGVVKLYAAAKAEHGAGWELAVKQLFKKKKLADISAGATFAASLAASAPPPAAPAPVPPPPAVMDGTSFGPYEPPLTGQFAVPSLVSVEAKYKELFDPKNIGMPVQPQPQLGGAFQKVVYNAKGSDGSEMQVLFKPDMAGPGPSLAAEAVSKLATMLLSTPTVPVVRMELGGKPGSVQQMWANKGTLGSTPITHLGPSRVRQLQNEQVFDWLVGDVDGHANNYLETADGLIVRVDRDRAFKPFLTGMATDDVPSWDTGAADGPSLPNKVLKAYASKALTLNPMDVLPLIERIEQMDDIEYIAAVDPYIKGVVGSDIVKATALLNKMLDRKKKVRAAFEAFYTKVLQTRGELGEFKFPVGKLTAVKDAPTLKAKAGFSVEPTPAQPPSTTSAPMPAATPTGVSAPAPVTVQPTGTQTASVTTPVSIPLAPGSDSGDPPAGFVVKQMTGPDYAQSKGCKVTDHLSDPEQAVIKAPKASKSLSDVDQVVKDLGLTPTGPSLTGGQYHMAFVNKASLSSTQIAKHVAKTVQPTVGSGVTAVAPPPELPKYQPKLYSLSEAPTMQPNFEALDSAAAADSPEASKRVGGLAVYGDGSVMEGQALTFRKVLDQQGQPYFKAVFKLRRDDWKALVKQAATTGGVEGTYKFAGFAYNKTKDALVDTGELAKLQSYTYETQATTWKSADGSSLTVMTNADTATALQGMVVADVKPMPGETPKAALARIMGSLDPKLTKKLLRNPTKAEQAEMTALRALWGTMPQVHDAFQELPAKQQTVEAVHKLLRGDTTFAKELFPGKYTLLDQVQGRALSEEELASIRPVEVCAGHVSHVLPGRWKKAGVKFLTHGTGNEQAVISILKDIAEGGLLSGVNQRLLRGMPSYGVSASDDLKSGSGDGVLVQAVQSGNGTVDAMSWANSFTFILPPDELDRLDAYGWNSDSYGATTGSTFSGKQYAKEKLASRPHVLDVAKKATSANEISFRKGIDARRILRVSCQNVYDRAQLITKAKAAGITEVSGVPIEDFIVLDRSVSDVYEKYVKPQGF